MERHEWHINHEDEDHEYWRANYHAGRWTIMTKRGDKRNSEVHWETIKTPTTEHWEALRDVLWRKYQRKRGSYKLLKKLDKFLGRTDEGANR